MNLNPRTDYLAVTGADCNKGKVTPLVATVLSNAVAGNVTGKWEQVQPIFNEGSASPPAGMRVFGSDGFVYRLIGDYTQNPVGNNGVDWVRELPDAQDTVAGIVKLNSGNATGDDTNNIDALTAKGLSILLSANGATYNAIQAALASMIKRYMADAQEVSV